MKLALLKNVDNDGLITVEGEQLIRLQEIVRGMADDVAAVCERYGLRYTLGGGSALGAVRHQGIIPWDDDMDLNLYRADYELFLQKFSECYSEKYWIHTPERTANYGLLFVQIRKKGTVAREREDISAEECGVPLDIFIIENTYNVRLLRMIHGVLCMGFKFALSCRKTWRDRERLREWTRDDPQAWKAIRLKICLGALVSPISVDRWTHLTDRCCKMCKKPGQFVVIPAGRKQFFGEIYPREIYLKSKLVPFDGHRYRLTEAADLYLRQLYGDYMKIPEENAREHHRVTELKL